jgi:hypothetical protein
MSILTSGCHSPEWRGWGKHNLSRNKVVFLEDLSNEVFDGESKGSRNGWIRWRGVWLGGRL